MSKMSELSDLIKGAYLEDTIDTQYWVSPQCVDCGEVEHADTLPELAMAIKEHICNYC